MLLPLAAAAATDAAAAADATAAVEHLIDVVGSAAATDASEWSVSYASMSSKLPRQSSTRYKQDAFSLADPASYYSWNGLSRIQMQLPIYTAVPVDSSYCNNRDFIWKF